MGVEGCGSLRSAKLRKDQGKKSAVSTRCFCFRIVFFEEKNHLVLPELEESDCNSLGWGLSWYIGIHTMNCIREK